MANVIRKASNILSYLLYPNPHAEVKNLKWLIVKSYRFLIHLIESTVMLLVGYMYAYTREWFYKPLGEVEDASTSVDQPFLFEYQLDSNGRYHLFASGIFPLPMKAKVVVHYAINGKDLALSSDTCDMQMNDDDGTIVFSDGLHISVSLINHNDGDGYQVVIHNRIRNDIVLQSVEVHLNISQPFVRNRETRIFQHGFQSWSPTGSVPFNAKQLYVTRFPLIGYLLNMGTYLHHDQAGKYWDRSDVLICNMLTVIQGAKDASVLLGFDDVTVACGEFVYMTDNDELRATLTYGKTLLAGQQIVTPTLLILKGDSNGVLEDFATIVASRASLPPVSAPSPVGWCSWYEFYTHVSATDMIDNATRMREYSGRSPLSIDVKYVQLDDGYQNAIGDWLDCNPKFPHGLGPMVEVIRSKGMEAGLWLAPYLIGQSSKIFKHHPDWLLRNTKGELIVATYNPDWGNDWKCYALDGTHPDAQQYLFTVFKTLRDLGITYFKIDFLAAGILPAKHYNTQMTRTEAYRAGMTAIRKGAGDAFILGCGAPIGASIGLVDGMRVSPDGAAAWNPVGHGLFMAPGIGLPSISYALQSDISRQFLHRKWWINDPDVVIPRDYTTALTHDEVVSQLTIVGLLGGSMFFSDDLRKLGEHRIQLMRQFSPPTRLSGRAVDIMDNTFGSIFLLAPPKFTPGVHSFVLAFLNWKDHASYVELGSKRVLEKVSKSLRIPTLDFGSMVFYDFWDGKVLPLNTSKVDVVAHGVKAFMVTVLLSENDRVPQLVGNSLNLTSQCDGRVAMIDTQEGRNSITVRGHQICSRSGSFWIKLPRSTHDAVIQTVVGCSAHIQRFLNTSCGNVYVEVSVVNTGNMESAWGVQVAAVARDVRHQSRFPTSGLDLKKIVLEEKEALRMRISKSMSYLPVDSTPVQNCRSTLSKGDSKSRSHLPRPVEEVVA